MLTIEEYLEANQADVYKRLQIRRSRFVSFWIWLDEQLDPVTEFIRGLLN